MSMTSTALETNTTTMETPLGGRKKLQLKPRSVDNVDGDIATGLPPSSPRSPRGRRVKSVSARGDPFGAALPREDVLKMRGIDPMQLDSRYERKSMVSRFTPDQELQVESIRAELTKLEAAWREANEKELPEEQLMNAAEAKRKELQEAMDKYAKRPDPPFDEGREEREALRSSTPPGQKQNVSITSSSSHSHNKKPDIHDCFFDTISSADRSKQSSGKSSDSRAKSSNPPGGKTGGFQINKRWGKSPSHSSHTGNGNNNHWNGGGAKMGDSSRIFASFSTNQRWRRNSDPTDTG